MFLFENQSFFLALAQWIGVGWLRANSKAEKCTADKREHALLHPRLNSTELPALSRSPITKQQREEEAVGAIFPTGSYSRLNWRTITSAKKKIG